MGGGPQSRQKLTRPIRIVIATVLLTVLVGASGAEAAQYFGKEPGKWSARILVRENRIKAVRIVVPASCRDQDRPSRFTWEVGWKGQPLNLKLRKHGGFFRESYTRWSKHVFKGRLTQNRIRAHLWFADRGDHVQCWTGPGPRPQWVSFTARKVRSG